MIGKRPFYFPIRLKMASASTVLILLISIFILYYYPYRFKKQAIESIELQMNSVAELMALGIGATYYASDIIALSEVLGRSKNDTSLVYISLLDTGSQVIATYDPKELSYNLESLIANSQIKEVDQSLWISYPIVFRSANLGTLYLVYDLAGVYRQVDNQRLTTLFICLVLIVIGTLLSFWLSTKLTKHIRELKDATYSIVAGDSGYSLNFEPTDEIGMLGIDFKKMVDRLNESHQKLLEHSKELEMTNKELNQFSYVTSHDLKAPLRSLSSLIIFIKTELNGQMNESITEYFELMESRITRMENLIEGILEYSRVGRKNTSKAEVDLNEVLNEVIDLMGSSENLQLTLEKELPLIYANRVRMQQLFQNLIGNAIKYCDKEVIKVHVSWMAKGKVYEFAVQDNGVGIESIYYEKIFEVFQTLNPRDEVEASGIGLSITKKIIEDRGGEIWLESELGVGTTFYFTLPVDS